MINYLVSIHAVAIFESKYFSQRDPDGESYHSQRDSVRDQVEEETEVWKSRRLKSVKKNAIITTVHVSVQHKGGSTWTHPVGISPTTSIW